ncbi:hypothetical protein ACFL5O_02290, partial [Myxococcota bacterium]
RARITEFIQGTMAEWVRTQAKAIQVLSLDGSQLTGYGKAVVAVEAGLADMRFVEVFRSVPLPEELGGSQELRDAYYSSLEQGLDPRKTRGRDATLVGLRLLGQMGVLKDPRVTRARALLSQLYNGRRIDALDGLMLGDLPALNVQTPEQRLASRLPTFYAARMLRPSNPADPALLRALLERGLPVTLMQTLDRAHLTAEARLLYARGMFELGRTYWRAADFGRARVAAQHLRNPSGPGRLLTALSLALEHGPKDAATMMLQGPMPQGIGNVSELDALAGSKDGASGWAAFNAAMIRELAPPTERNPAFFEDLAVRYNKAAQLLPARAAQALARDRARGALATAAALR